ncbi:MAG: hypothetical protein JXB07_16920 [Anaerolineae bacterium]|nr:hypothetical protein [Anaerolineae bacterium]
MENIWIQRSIKTIFTALLSTAIIIVWNIVTGQWLGWQGWYLLFFVITCLSVWLVDWLFSIWQRTRNVKS